jgi:hypothetical protein
MLRAGHGIADTCEVDIRSAVDPHRLDLLLVPVPDRDLRHLGDVGDLALGLLLVAQQRGSVDGGRRVAGR